MTEAAQASPALTSERDAGGRLVAVSFEGARAAVRSGANRWLVALDDSQCAQRAVAQAARLAAMMPGCGVELISVQPWLAKEAADTELPQRGWTTSAAARQLLDQAGIPWLLHVVMGDAAACIVARADPADYHGVVIGSHGRTVPEAMLLGSVAYKVIHLSRLPVLVVR